jgi:membrane associated rhomboid family serine protease
MRPGRYSVSGSASELANIGDFSGPGSPPPPATPTDYNQLMSSIGLLPDTHEGRLPRTPRYTDSASYASVADDDYTSRVSTADWWNEGINEAQIPKPLSQRRHRPSRPSLPPARPEYAHRTLLDDADSDSEDSKLEDLPIVVMEAPSPLIWTIGTIVIGALCIACEILQEGSILSYNTNPMFGAGLLTMLRMGAKSGAEILDGEVWRIITAVFVQNGILSLVLTAMALWFLREVERDYGYWKASLLFLIAGSFGYVVSELFIPNAVTCGGTGAVFGFVGFLATELGVSWSTVEKRVRKLVTLVVITVVFLITGFTPFVDNWGISEDWSLVSCLR